jgi:hypothetical protein
MEGTVLSLSLRASCWLGTCKHGHLLTANAKQIADGMQIHYFAASDGWICRFKDHHGLIHKNLFGESTVTNSDMRDL